MKPTDEVKRARQKRRQKTGWSMDEIIGAASKEFAESKNVKAKEPRGFASGDMKRAVEGDENDEEC